MVTSKHIGIAALTDQYN